jgi:hypothetical protein
MQSSWHVSRSLQTGQAAPALQPQPLQSRLHSSIRHSHNPQRLNLAFSSSRSSSSSSRHSKPAGHLCPRPELQPRHTPSHPSTVVAAAAQQVTAADEARAARLAAPVVVIGGGPAGLCTALMLARRGYSNIKVRANTAACCSEHVDYLQSRLVNLIHWGQIQQLLGVTPCGASDATARLRQAVGAACIIHKLCDCAPLVHAKAWWQLCSSYSGAVVGVAGLQKCLSGTTFSIPYDSHATRCQGSSCTCACTHPPQQCVLLFCQHVSACHINRTQHNPPHAIQLPLHS